MIRGCRPAHQQAALTLSLLMLIMLALAGCLRSQHGGETTPMPPDTASTVVDTPGTAEAPVPAAEPLADAPPDIEPLEPEASLPPMALRTLGAARIHDERLLLRGPLAQGQFGDFAIFNEHVHAVITSSDHLVEPATTGGVLIDLALRQRGADFFGLLEPTSNSLGNPDLKLTTVEVTHDGADGTMAEVVATGQHITARGTPIVAKVFYRLRPGDRSVEITTEFTNVGTEPTGDLYPADSVHWGGLAPFAPRFGYMPLAGTQWRNYEAVWFMGLDGTEDVSVAIHGADRAIYGRHVQTNTRLRYAFEPTELAAVAPGNALTMVRHVQPGTRDMAETLTDIYARAGIPTGQLAGRMMESGSQVPVADAEVRLQLVIRGEEGLRPFASTLTNSSGEYAFSVPPGEYFIVAAPLGRRAPSANVSVFVEQGAILETQTQVTPPIQLEFDIRDADTDENIPAKLTFSTGRDKPLARLGHPWTAPSAGNTYYSLTGRGRLIVPQVDCAVTVTAGPEYESHLQNFSFSAIGRQRPYELTVKLKRVNPMPGWVGVDIGPKTNASPGCLVTPEARIISAVCEGVQLLIVTDHNTLTDLRPVVRDLGLENRLQVAGGIQFRDYSRQMPGVFSVFPIDLDTPPEVVQAVASQVTTMTDPATIFQTLRAAFPGALIQVDDPIHPERGYLRRMGYEDRGTAPTYTQWADGWSGDFDLVQVMHGREVFDRKAFRDRYEAWMQVILTGHSHVRFTGGSESYGILTQETGYPRLYVRTTNRQPGSIPIAEITQNIRQGRVVASMGPMVESVLGTFTPGTVATPDDNKWLNVELMRILGPRWTRTHAIIVEREGRLFNLSYVVGEQFPEQFPSTVDSRPLRRLRFLRDAFLTFIVEGQHAMIPELAATSPYSNDAPVARALTGPLIVDSDGDGQYTPPPPSRRFRD